jgi:hypothetical protein
VCSNENAQTPNQGSHQNIIPHLLEPIILGLLSEEEFVKSKDRKGCNSYQHDKLHYVNEPRHKELLERIPYNLMCYDLGSYMVRRLARNHWDVLTRLRPQHALRWPCGRGPTPLAKQSCGMKMLA